MDTTTPSRGRLSRKTLIVQFASYLLLVSVANGLGTLWPVYLVRLGGSLPLVGYFTAVGTLGLTIGTIGSGWLADRLKQQRILFILACAVFGVGLVAMSRIHSLSMLTLVNFTNSIAIGTGYNMIFMLTGLRTGQGERGRAFGIVAFTAAVGTTVGGLTSGPIVDRWGFPELFLLSAVVVGCTLIIALTLQDIRVAPDTAAISGSAGDRTPLGRNFPFMIAAALFSAATYFIGQLGLLATMNRLGYAATNISFTIAIGAMISMPAPLLMGWLSDRIGRKRLVLACYVGGMTSLTILAWAQSLGSFWAASALLALLSSSSAAGTALVTDSVPPKSLGTALSLTAAASHLGGLVGSPSMGLILQHLGQRNAFLACMLVPLAAIAVILPIREQPFRKSHVVSNGAQPEANHPKPPSRAGH